MIFVVVGVAVKLAELRERRANGEKEAESQADLREDRSTDEKRQTDRQTEVRRVRQSPQPPLHKLNKLPTSLNIYPVARTTDILPVPVF